MRVLPLHRSHAARLVGLLSLGLACLVGSSGCATDPAPAAGSPSAPKDPEAKVARVVVKDVTDYEDFTGKTEALAAVDVRARVTGYLHRRNFKDGEMVEKGKVLFEIDPSPFAATLAQAEANIRQMEARRTRLEADYERDRASRQGGSISKADLDKTIGDLEETRANYGAMTAARDLAKINLEWTKVRAPLSGRISRRFVDEGNLVKADETILTTIVAVDPIYANFDVDERTVLRVQRLTCAGQCDSIREKQVPVALGLSDEEGFPHQGVVDFVDNQLDKGTGTLRFRGLFPNKEGLLAPGLFARCRLQVGNPHKAVLVAERALGTDQGQKFVYVVNDKSEIEYRKVQTGSMHDGLRVIEPSTKPGEGVRPGERVVVEGVQFIRPKGPDGKATRVTPLEEPMPRAELALSADR
jgi:RND family efflux transporter MFP subunit